MEKAQPQVWYYNFSSSVAAMIDEYKKAGYVVRAVKVSPSIYNKIANILGHEPDNMLGYKLEVMWDEEYISEKLKSMHEDELENEDEAITNDDCEGYVGLRADPIN